MGRSRRPRALGAFCFAGGFTVGVRQHFDVEHVLEGDGGYGVSTARLNFPDLKFHYGPTQWPLDELAAGPELDFIYGNPPCAAWSGNNPKSHVPGAWRQDPRVACTRQHFTLLERLRPKVWAWESVTQAPTKGAELVEELTAAANALGYSVTQLFHDAQWLGAPQVRRRWFLVCHRVAYEPLVPNWAPPTTVREALDGLRPVGEPAYDTRPNRLVMKPLLAKVPEGWRLNKYWDSVNPPEKRQLNSQGNIQGRPAFGHVRLRNDQPAGATVGYAMVHPTEHRFLAINEVAHLAGFPSDFQFLGQASGNEQLDLIARGVLPPVGEWLARSVASAVTGGGKPVGETVNRAIDYRLPPHLAALERRPTVPRAAPVTSSAPPSPPGVPCPPPWPGAKSGAYIRALLLRGHQAAEILTAVHAGFEGSKASAADVSWNRKRLADQGNVEPTTPSGWPDNHNKTGVVLTTSPEKMKKYSSSAERPKKYDAPPATTQLDLPWEDGAKAPKAAPTRNDREPRAGVDPDREFDTTSLRANAHGQWVHRDYGAHFFRWGFAGRFVTGTTEVLDVGCGPDVPMIDVLTMPRNQVPARYIGVDLNRSPRQPPSRGWATLHWEFDFLKNHKRLGQFDLVTNFEVIEHMDAENGLKLLKGLRACLKPDGACLLSTPVFNGKAAKNHIHEYTVDELARAVAKAGFRVEQRFGTFASQKDLKKVATAEERVLVERLGAYYSGEVLSCFLAPLYPDAARNNVWLLRHK